MAAMAFDKAPGQRKPDSGATAFTAAGLVRTIKIIKYMGQICRRNPLAIIRYRQKQRSPGRPAVNPDIPPSRQFIPLRLSTAAPKGWHWKINGKKHSPANNAARWLPQPGRHRISLHDANGAEIDQAHLEVRTLRGRPAGKTP